MGNRLLPGTIGERIRDLRTGRRMTQDELAKQLAISKSALSRIESGETATVNSDIVQGTSSHRWTEPRTDGFESIFLVLIVWPDCGCAMII